MAESSLAIIILAAGKGTRMRSALPKVLHQIAGLPMLGHVIYTAESLSPQKIVIVAAPDQVEQFRPYTGKHEIVVQDEQLGTGHAVRCAKDALKNFTGDVLILYGDVPLVRPETLRRLLHKKHFVHADAALLGFHAANPHGYGRLIATADRLIRIVEEKDAIADEREIHLCSSGLMSVSAPALWQELSSLKNHNAQNEFYLPDILAALPHACFTMTDESEVMGINDRAQLAAAESIWQTHRRDDAMMAGVTLQSPETIIFSPDTEIAADVTLGAHVVFGPGVTVEGGAEILPFSHLEGCVIKSGARVGPFARIRPGSVIGPDARIGNFVEIKNSNIGAGAKANHLSYIGDTTVGAKANIGAGTITCNYDGINKYKTDIGPGAFIGSNSALIAPVFIGEGAIIGAGSVISKDVPSGALGIARVVQKNIAGWATKFFSKEQK